MPYVSNSLHASFRISTGESSSAFTNNEELDNIIILNDEEGNETEVEKLYKIINEDV